MFHNSNCLALNKGGRVSSKVSFEERNLWRETPIPRTALLDARYISRGKKGEFCLQGKWKKTLLDRDDNKWNVSQGHKSEPGQQQWNEDVGRLDTHRIASLLQGPISPLDGKRLHALLIRNGLDQGMFLGNLLVNMYGKLGYLEDARTVFNKMHERNVISWNIMITAYTQQSNGKEALCLFRLMQEEGVKPSKVTFISVLSACASVAALEEGEMLHASIVNCGLLSDVVVATALVTMYSKCRALRVARSVFNQMRQRNVVSWNAMIAAYAQYGQGRDALQLFNEMKQDGIKPDKVTFISLLSACAGLADVAEGHTIHACIIELGFEADIVVGNGLINMYGKCCALVEARSVFDSMRQRDLVSWNTMIATYIQHGHAKKALQLFQQMQEEGIKPDKFSFVSTLGACVSLAALAEGEMSQTALAEGKRIHASIIDSGLKPHVAVENALVNMYGKCGSLENARSVFDNMHEHDVVSWNAMLGAYVQHGHGKDALLLFQQMQKEGMKPDRVTFLNVLGACASLAALAEGRAIHYCVVEDGLESDVIMGTALVNMYGKCGALQDAHLVFSQMHRRNVISWNAIIDACAQHGYGKQALHLFHQMNQEGVKPDEVTFIGLLSACSHAGLVNEGYCYFISMSKDHGIKPTLTHYGCMVDLFGRAGQLQEAESFIHKMPLQANALVWMALLGACRMHGDVERGKRAAEQVIDLDPANCEPFILLSNLYAADGRWDDVEKLGKKYVGKGCKRKPRMELNSG